MADTTPTSLKGMIQQMTGGDVALYQGTVTATGSLKIKIANDDKLVLTESNTYVPEHLKNHTLKVSIPDAGISNAEMTVNAALETGDTVHVLSLFKGKQNFVLGRA